MNSKRIDKEELQKEKYPCLMEDDEIVIFFTTEGRGFVMNSTDRHHPIGSYSELWDMDDFKPFHGEIILSNEED